MRVCPIKLVIQVTSNFCSGRYILESDNKYSSEYEAEFTQPIGIKRKGNAILSTYPRYVNINVFGFNFVPSIVQ